MSNDEDPAEHWDERYRDAPIWSGRPNRVLTEEVGDLPQGTALDVGCGEGADIVWLAECGWRATGIDVSGEALERAADAARRRGVAERTTWQRIDLNAEVPSGSYGLVTSHFLHSTVRLDRDRILAALPGLVAPGGTLLVVGHAEPPPWHRHDGAHGLPSVDEVLRALDLDGGWAVVRAEVREREATSRDGVSGLLRDTVVRAERRAAAPTAGPTR